MLSLYRAVVDKYLIRDLEDIILRYMCDGLYELSTVFNRNRFTYMQMFTRLPPEGLRHSQLCWTCHEYIKGDESMFVTCQGFHNYHPIHNDCLFYDILLEDCKRYKDFLMLVYPRLIINLH